MSTEALCTTSVDPLSSLKPRRPGSRFCRGYRRGGKGPGRVPRRCLSGSREADQVPDFSSCRLWICWHEEMYGTELRARVLRWSVRWSSAPPWCTPSEPCAWLGGFRGQGLGHERDLGGSGTRGVQEVGRGPRILLSDCPGEDRLPYFSSCWHRSCWPEEMYCRLGSRRVFR